MTSARKIHRGDPERAGCPVGKGEDGVWRVSGYTAGRAVLRSADTVQAGLGIESVEKLPARIRRPVLYRDGKEHREHRRQTARYFTPRRVDERYRSVMIDVAEGQLATLRARGRAELADLSFHLAIEVACAVIGLTDSKPGIKDRLESFFPEKIGKPGLTSPHGLYWLVRHNANWLRFYLADVRPAVKRRRKRRRDDLLSHLIDEGCNAGELLGECLTFAAAGMITTREFVNVAAWHLFTDDALAARYREADEAGRIEILHEILRLEPVVASLRRRTTAPLPVPVNGADGPDGGDVVIVPEGELIDVEVSLANLDEAAVGADPLAMCPGRPLGPGAPAMGLSFGDGAHKCPGSSIAILETDVFLSRLMAIPGVRMVAPPRVSIAEAIGGYELRGLVVETG
ncbi:Cytochrome P450 [Prauserella marina]|uniref:Cytochrome P450 n=1 Tax=Prauserella marina TaxID=530584 RepID=A0A1G6VIB7_9PSEU|nr:cytochrome P450 [Prauserella marina]PWV80393.1 cytochrome P450 [Prauserella marina]SDD53362.1 Cytochrome P450 [Prauserella marina]